ncbi:hypothetical protein JCM8547_002850 [Rhodosporidiobolus lusitaniae]
MPSLSSLPVELLRLIIHFASLPPSNSPPTPLDAPSFIPPLHPLSPRFLASLALVHPSWTPIVEDELTETVYIGPEGPHESLVEVLGRRKRDKRAAVRRVIVEGPGRRDEEGVRRLEREGVWESVKGVRVLGGDEMAEGVLEGCKDLRILIIHSAIPAFHIPGPMPRLKHLVLSDNAQFSLLTPLTEDLFPALDNLVLDLNTRSMSAFVPVRMGGGNSLAAGGGAVAIGQPFYGGPHGVGSADRLGDSFPSMSILPRIVSLTLRVYSSAYSHPFLTSLIQSSISPSTGRSTAALKHLRVETSGTTEAWMSIAPLLSILDDLECPLSSLYVDYALLEPLLYKLHRAPHKTPLPRCLSNLSVLTLSHFLGLAQDHPASLYGVSARYLKEKEKWKDLESLSTYLEPFQREDKNGGRGLRVELRKIPKGLIEDGDGGEHEQAVFR